MWVSPQGFPQDWMDEFLTILATEPPWLTGVVHGPQVRLSLEKLRAAVPKRYQLRNYPDITHSLTCQYPVPDWDQAFALTQGREGIWTGTMLAVPTSERPERVGAVSAVRRPLRVKSLTP